MDLQDISNSDIEKAIDEWIKGEKNRAILKRRLIDQIHYEPLSVEFELSERQVKNIVYKQQQILFKHLGRE